MPSASSSCPTIRRKGSTRSWPVRWRMGLSRSSNAMPRRGNGTDWGKQHAMRLDSWPVFQLTDPRLVIAASAHRYWVGTEDERKAPHRIIIAKVTQDDTLFVLRRGANGDRLELQALSLSMGNDRAAKGSDRLAGLVLESQHPIGILARPTATTSCPGGRFRQGQSPCGQHMMVGHPASVRQSARRAACNPQDPSNYIVPSSQTSGPT